MRIPKLPVLLLCALLVACGSEKATPGKTAEGEEPLPRPDAAGGSVTGMPNPGASTPDPGQPIDQAAPDFSAIPADGPIVDPAAVAAAAGPEPGADAAVEVIRDYYAAINAKDFARAHALWRQNPQSPEQFAAGFATTNGVSLEIGPPGPVDAGAGQRHIEIPVRLEASHADGHIERYAGHYLLQRSVVEGGDPDWKIARADLARQ